MRTFSWLLFIAVVVTACDKPQSGNAATASSSAVTSSPAGSTPAAVNAPSASTSTASAGPLTADPPFGNITPTKKAPFEAVRFRMRSERGAAGWPEYDVANLSNKTIAYLNIYGYAYDKDGKQVARTKPLGWSDELEPGKQSSVRVGRFGDKVADAAVAFELCYTTIRFDGEKKPTRDDERCPEQKPKSK